MDEATAHLIALLASTGAGVWMTVAGVRKSALEWRKPKRTCPSCGRNITGNTCACSL
jgi:hypothetical protein